MADPVRLFTAEVENEPPQPHPQQQQQNAAIAAANAAAQQMVLLALKTLSQRTIIALHGLFVFATVCLVFWTVTLYPNPTTEQLIAMGIFSVFVLAINFLHLRRLR